MAGLLALDTSLNVGWAYFARPTVPPLCGTWHAPYARPGIYGSRFSAFRCWLDDMLGQRVPAVVAFESPFSQFPGHTMRLLFGFVAIAEELTHAHGIACLEFAPASVKLRLAGHGHADGEAMIVAATRRGFSVADDHQADACGIALCAFDHLATS